MTGGWQRQLGRIERWHQRILSATNVEDGEDFLYAFFQNSFALRDWIIDTGAANQQQMEHLFSRHVELRINRDIANALKHYSITRPSQEQPPSFAVEYSPEDPSFGSPTRLVILSEGLKYDAVDLATRCLSIWRAFLKQL